MDFNIKDGSSYLDGVPVKISSKFIPPRPVTLPYAIDDNTNIDFFQNLYDFTLEKNVIDSHTKRIHQLEEAKIKPPADNVSSLNGGSSQQDALPTPHSSAQSVLSLQGNSILQPQHQQPQDSSVKTETSQKGHLKINLSDFENDTSSPFDYMELQTINDLEELNSVFQGIHSHPSQEEPTPVNISLENPLNVSKSKSFPLPSNSSDSCSAVVGANLGSFSVSSYEIPHTISTMRHVDNFSGDSYMKLSQVPYIPSNTGAHVSPIPAVRVPSNLRPSKSYSDLSSLGNAHETYSENKRSRTPPSTFSYSTDLKETPSEEEALEAPSIPENRETCDNDLPDPYNELDSSAQEFVDCITEMGFSRPQVARTVKHLGTDEKKVVEHLCQIQAMEESGYEGIEAEAALHLHDYNREEAKMFLDLVNQFQDLGFEKKAVKKALVQNKNDWNKTIDALLL